MAILRVALSLYFAAVLSVSGFSKLQRPDQFALNLLQQQLLPDWSVHSVSRLVPVLEILIAGMLVTGIAPVFTGSIIVCLFSAFFAIEAILLITKRAEDCGCYGVAYVQKVSKISVISSGILLGFSVLYFWSVLLSSPPNWILRIVFCCIVVVGDLFLTVRTIQYRHQSMVPAPEFPASRLKIGDPIPIDLGIPLPHRVILLFASHSCRPCIELSKRLSETNASDWHLIIVSSEISQEIREIQGGLEIPAHAQCLEDCGDNWFRLLGAKARPTALALMDGHLVNQRVGPSPDWFANPSIAGNGTSPSRP